MIAVHRWHSLARVLGMTLLTLPLLLSVDVVSAGVALVAILLYVPWSGLGWRRTLRRSTPILLAAPLAGLSMLLYGRPEGREYASFLFAHVTENSVALAAAITVRVCAVGLPAVIFTTDLDTSDLAAGMVHILRLPERFVLAATAALRLTTLFREDWQAVGRARRSRGLGDSGRLRRVVSQVFALLVFALRRGSTLATAMEARGFGAPGPRTWIRQARFAPRDWALLGACLIVSTVALAVSLTTGSFRLLGA